MGPPNCTSVPMNHQTCTNEVATDVATPFAALCMRDERCNVANKSSAQSYEDNMGRR